METRVSQGMHHLNIPWLMPHRMDTKPFHACTSAFVSKNFTYEGKYIYIKETTDRCVGSQFMINIFSISIHCINFFLLKILKSFSNLFSRYQSTPRL